MAQRNPYARVIVQQWVSLDGFAAGPGGEMDIVAAVDEDADMRSQQYNDRLLSGVSAVMLGRRTYQQFAGYWPGATEPIAPRINEIPKVVASRTLRKAGWGSHRPAMVVADPVAHLQAFRREQPANLIVWGSLSLTAALFAADQIDELDLFVVPVWLGEGTPVLPASPPRRLRQIVGEDWGTISHLRYWVPSPGQGGASARGAS
ncbi:Dihydrofolate reductase [Propionibacterium cyclohexanicum]|uniref:Dihydrofolate reductase n=1 Tax=Propionibacterium cyclohexanicum TaxID=64702 RepID=A0A1H9U1K2_9ACTN|nr:dihydrofolate reductase family protein [Propionibacterium cyclohexanicum]SES02953.1 Dihydrofolate reductase [Propionibacterium cyclohexanicum]